LTKLCCFYSWDPNNFDIIKKFLNARPHKHQNCVWTLFGYSKCSKSASPTFMYFVDLFLSKIRDSFVNWTCRKLSRIFCSLTFNSETVLCWWWCFQKRFVHRSTDVISQGFRSGELDGHCSSSVVCGQFACRPLLSDTCSVYRAPHISLNLHLHLHQSVAVFNDVWKQKLINNFNICCNDATKITSQSLSCQAGITIYRNISYLKCKCSKIFR